MILQITITPLGCVHSKSQWEQYVCISRAMWDVFVSNVERVTVKLIYHILPTLLDKNAGEKKNMI